MLVALRVLSGKFNTGHVGSRDLQQLPCIDRRCEVFNVKRTDPAQLHLTYTSSCVPVPHDQTPICRVLLLQLSRPAPTVSCTYKPKVVWSLSICYSGTQTLIPDF